MFHVHVQSVLAAGVYKLYGQMQRRETEAAALLHKTYQHCLDIQLKGGVFIYIYSDHIDTSDHNAGAF